MTTSITQLSQHVIQHISQWVLGKPSQIMHTLCCLIAGGHILLEDVPGTGKTTLAKALAATLAMNYKRIQCTPDLMPSDITGNNIYNPLKQQFEFIQGPIFSQIVLVDEINRSPPRTQSALLEAMSEGTVTIDQQTYTLPEPFFVIATQNPIEFVGTYPLPEAQMDRFMMRISLGYPDEKHELLMLNHYQSASQLTSLNALLNVEHIQKLRLMAEQIKVSEALLSYINSLVRATRQHPDITLGASPRAAIALIRASKALALLNGHTHVTPAIVQHLFHAVIAHRLITKHQQTTAISTITQSILNHVAVPDYAA